MPTTPKAPSMTPEEAAIAIGAHDITTYRGYISAVEALLAGKPDWTGLKVDNGYFTSVDGHLFSIPEAPTPDHLYDADEDGFCDPDEDAWSDITESWDGMAPGVARDALQNPVFFMLPHLPAPQELSQQAQMFAAFREYLSVHPAVMLSGQVTDEIAQALVNIAADFAPTSQGQPPRGPQDYTVRYEVSVTALSPEEAASFALADLRDRSLGPWSADVVDATGTVRQVASEQDAPRNNYPTSGM